MVGAVRRARTGESMVTLDGERRGLDPDDLLICDGSGRPVGLAGVIGGLLGAVAGGFIGNRVWDSQRLGGTLLGAGLGGIAGAAAGSAIEAADDRRSDDECALYLDRHMA